jgi:2-succinyl-5-enolpyruvyl-6-hydroxy-3-cyclohexene-1-carboxylate synthase
MFSTNPNIQQLTALLLKADVRQVVVCPGSRNAALVHNFQMAGLQCYEVTDERSAGFFAIGLMEANGGLPVAVCVTSGSAVLNLAPAVSEAYYRVLPLMVISADRPQRWVGQMDGQTLPQQDVFGQLSVKSVALPEADSDEELWHCNRLVNETLIEMRKTKRPVHINVPIAEPLFDFSSERLPEVRLMQWANGSDGKFLLTADMRQIWESTERVLILVGQMLPNEMAVCAPLLSQLSETHCLVCAEHLSNIQTANEPLRYIGNFDEMLHAQAFDAPDLLITFGGHIVSKSLKKYLRNNPPAWHWHISPQGDVADLFMCCTHLVETQPQALLSALNQHESAMFGKRKDYQQAMFAKSASVRGKECWGKDFCDLTVLKTIKQNLEHLWHVQVANSSMIRNWQLFDGMSNPVHGNRGVNGIEGSVSAAVGYWVGSGEPTLLLTGDLSFFYDKNGLWNKYVKSPSVPLRILLLNNHCGQIFHHLPELESPCLEHSISAQHDTVAEGVAMECGAKYLKAKNAAELEQVLEDFLDVEPVVKILEVVTERDVNVKAHKEFYSLLKPSDR